MKKWFLALPLALCLNACTPTALLISAAVGIGGSLYLDKRNIHTILDDHHISSMILNRIRNDKKLNASSSINASTFNGAVLLIGQTQTAEMRKNIEKTASKTKGVKKIFNEIKIAAPDGSFQHANDTWITTKVKTELFTKRGIQSSEIKIVTSNGTVYIQGKASAKTGKQIADIVRRISGVNRVVKVFEPEKNT
jgi:osmotically-inducible protein OsmY